MVLILYEVLVLECCPATFPTFDLTTELTALKIIDSRHIIFVVKTQRVAHHYQVYLLIVLHFDGVDAVYAGQERCGVLFQVLVEAWEDFLDEG